MWQPIFYIIHLSTVTRKDIGPDEPLQVAEQGEAVQDVLEALRLNADHKEITRPFLAQIWKFFRLFHLKFQEEFESGLFILIRWCCYIINYSLAFR